MVMRAVVIDDEKTSRETIIHLLHEHKNVEVIGEASTVQDAIELISNEEPNLVFLDIRLQGGSGFDVTKALSHIAFNVIFTTAYSQYAVQAIRLSALGYLLKPIDPNELKHAIEKAATQSNSQLKSGLDVLTENLASKEPNRKRIIISNVSGFQIVNLKDIVCCEAERNYTRFHLANNSTLVTSKSLIEFERMLPASSFVRVHKSYLVNVEHVRKYIGGRSGSLMLSNESSIPLSRDRKAHFIKILEDHL